jgi:hypothetical protein
MVMVPALPAEKVPSARRGATVPVEVAAVVAGRLVEVTPVEDVSGILLAGAAAVLPVTSTALVGTTEVDDTAATVEVAGGAADEGAGAAARRTTEFTMAAALPTTSNEHTEAMVATLTFIPWKG